VIVNVEERHIYRPLAVRPEAEEEIVKPVFRRAKDAYNVGERK
jgi:hypothetical protein